MDTQGATTWFIPDGYLATPQGSDPNYKNHESICVLNTTSQDAQLTIDFYFADRAPLHAVGIVIPAERCYHLRIDLPEQIGGCVLPFDTPYGARLHSDVPVVVQYSRMYATIQNISLMTTMAFPIS
ncbi:MAG: hypothetical protein H7Y11_05925 [Armatimonadetes bacterium]|nr:hypothetical protein [Anaerolineae bacterium]